MSPSRIFRACRVDPGYLLRVYLAEWVVLSALLATGAWLRGASLMSMELGPAHALLPLVAVPVGWRAASLLHNAGHGNFGAVWLNRLVGEGVANYLGYGFTNFVLIHALHHAYSDEDDDPVSPRGKSFSAFLVSPLRDATRTARAHLRDRHGARHTPLHWHAETVLFHVLLLLRAACWFVWLGPEVFLTFYVPSVMSNVAILAHINFVCHRDRPDGTVELVDLTDTLYYRLANFVTTGGYHHRSHHLHPRLFDPRTAPREPSVPTERPPGLAGYFDIAGIWGPR